MWRILWKLQIAFEREIEHCKFPLTKLPVELNTWIDEQMQAPE